MNRPALEVADIVRAAGNSFWQQQQSHLAWPHRKVLDAIVRCRTAALGGHRDQCTSCGHQAILFNSCRNRHCPKCQGNARAKWLAARSAEPLPVPYFHIVFTLLSFSQLFGVAFQSYLGTRTLDSEEVAPLPHVAPRRHGCATMLILCKIAVALKGSALKPRRTSPLHRRSSCTVLRH
jgi:hypothetical protein